MSVISNSIGHSQQQISVRTANGSRGTPNNLKTAESLVSHLQNSTTPLSEKQQDAAQSLIKDYKEAVGLNSSISRSLKDNKDALREQRVERIQERIKQLKEMLRFASPEQAKRMLKELKQVSKEFSKASKDLNKAADSMGTGAPNAAVQTATSIVSSVLESTVGSAQKSGSGTAVEDTTVKPATPGATSATARTVATPAPTKPAEEATVSASDTDQQGPQTGPQQREELVSAVRAYADRQAETDKAHYHSRVDSMRDEHENLRKISDQLKNLASRLEALADKSDKESGKDLKETWNAIKKGIEELNDPELHKSLEVAVPESTASDHSASVSSVSVNTPAPVSITSNILV